MLVIWIWVYRDISSSVYTIRSLTWLKTVSIMVCGSYWIDLVFCSRSTSWLEEIFSCVTVQNWMNMKSVPVNYPVILFLMDVMYLDLPANVRFWISACSTTHILWKTRRFSSYWSFSSSWAWRVTNIGMMNFPGWNWQTNGVLMKRE